jgi:hypothetical protein
MNIKGKIKVINPTIVVSDKFSKREFVVETEETYPQPISIQLTKDKCSLLDLFKVGQDVEVSVNLRGREWNSPQGETKYFNTIEAWKITSLAVAEKSIQNNIPVGNIAIEDDGLPF